MSAETRPAPLVPAEVDLRGFPFMPMHGDVLRTSGFNAAATDAEFRAAYNLWWSSWWQIPGASLPNNDVELCRLADMRDMRRWHKVRAAAMKKWVLCSDDRWYHPFLAYLAVEAFSKRKSYSLKGAIGAEKRWRNKAGANGSANAPAIQTNGSAISTGNSPAINSDSPANSKVSEVNNPLTPFPETRTSKPPVPSKAITNTTHRVEEQRSWITTPPPGGKLPSEFLKDAARATSFEDLKP